MKDDVKAMVDYLEANLPKDGLLVLQGFLNSHPDELFDEITKRIAPRYPNLFIVKEEKKIYWTGQSNKSCFNCINSAKFKGFPDTRLDPGEPNSTECGCPDVGEDLLDNNDEEILPEKCGHYNPVMVDEKCYCGKEINRPEFEHEYWFNWFDNKPCCSDKCVKLLKKKYKEEE